MVAKMMLQASGLYLPSYLGYHHSSKGNVKGGASEGSVIGIFLFLILIYDLADEKTWNYFFFVDDIKPVAPRSQQHELRSSIQQAFTWPHIWDLPLHARKSHHLSIGGTPNLRIALSEEADGKSLKKCEQSNDLGITVNAANVLAAANKARGMLYFLKRSLTCLTEEIFVPLYSVLVRLHLEYAIQANCPYLKNVIEEEEKLALFMKRIINFQQMIRCKEVLLRKDWRRINLLRVAGLKEDGPGQG